jgi:hypothetical protein
MRQMWIVIQLGDSRVRKAVYEKAEDTIHDMSGEIVKAGGLGDLVLTARFPHRRYRTLENAIAAAVNTLPVERTIVTGQDPYVLRENTAALTMELYRRQDQVVGL